MARIVESCYNARQVPIELKLADMALALQRHPEVLAMKRDAAAQRELLLAYDGPEFSNRPAKEEHRRLMLKGFANWPLLLNRLEPRFAEVDVPEVRPSPESLAEGFLAGLQVRQEKWD